ncbi:MAG: hypothetical protein JWM80_3977 [Cyanobacteria bacterium RYN_339]|nr:hypothetical protein [Cyanobacteria bacterium RYN_339]
MESRRHPGPIGSVAPATPADDTYAQAAADLRTQCAAANSEMTVAARCEAMLAPLLATHGVDYRPTREARVVATRRRIDSQFGAVVTEYKERLGSQRDWDAAAGQLVGYVEAIAPEPAQRDQHVGVLTDGRQLAFVTFEGGHARLELPGVLDGPRLRRYVETLVALGRRGLTQRHLVEDFAAVRVTPGGLGRALATACYEALRVATAKTGMLQSEWQRIFAQSVDHHVAPEAHAEAYREALELPAGEAVEARRALFALQTGYALVVKLVAARVLADSHVGHGVLGFDRLAAYNDEDLRAFLARLEDGGLLRSYGLENLLEGDFFGWYATPTQWTPALATTIRAVIQRLADYEGRAPRLLPGSLGDMFRQLYQRTIPAVIRHDLGEYYTPRWLAQAVLESLPKTPAWRGLDPCCGSGTFVVEMIAEALAETEHLEPGVRLEQVLRRVHGIDLNPLAVLTARVNYFLAIAHLLADARTVEIPVYLGDAAFVPSPCDLDGVPGLAYTLPTALGPLDVALPLALARRGAVFGEAMRAVEQAVIQLDAAAGRAALARAIGPEASVPAVADAVAHFVDALVALERKDWDRIWARLVKNFLATAALEPFDRIAGNPPWVTWKDLPDGYRDTIRALCRARGIFSDDGYAGGTDLNVCLLIAHTVLERWVVPGGYLGFLMPRQLLQVRSAQGFRRWRLPDGERLGLRALADWTALRPFDAACQPATYLIQRGNVGPAVVPMSTYKPGTSQAIRDPGASWRAARQGLEVLDEGAAPVDADGGPYMIDQPALLPALKAILGEPAYRGRRATETSPHAVYWVRPVADARAPGPGLELVENALNPRSREPVGRSHVVIERDLLFPLLRGKGVKPFKATPEPMLVILPHDASSGAKPLPPERMPPLTLAYLTDYRTLLEARSSYREYRAGQPFYGLWRVGPYSFAPFKVVWPEMGELRAAVISDAPTPWGERKPLVAEGKVNLIPCDTAQEAHFVCALLNAPIVRRAYQRMSSQIGRPSRLPVALPAFDAARFSHRALAALSLAAHGDGDGRTHLLAWLAGRVLPKP